MKLYFDTEVKDFIINSVYFSSLADEIETQIYANLLQLFLDDFEFLSYIKDFELTAKNYGYFRDTARKQFTKETFDELERLFHITLHQ